MDNKYSKMEKKENNYARHENVESILTYGEYDNIPYPELSIVIPTFNRVDTLQNIIDVIYSNLPDYPLEIVIVDNSGNLNSDNPTLQYVRSVNKKEILYFRNRTNIGQAGNMNRCFELARAEYISMIHDDDLIKNQYLKLIRKAIEIGDRNRNLGFIKVNYDEFSEFSKDIVDCNEDAIRIKKIGFSWCLARGIGPTSRPSCGIVFKKKSVLETGGFNEDYFPSFDYVLGYRMLLFGYDCYILRQHLGLYRWGVNETLKKENVIGFCTADHYFRKNMYKHNAFSRIYGSVLLGAYDKLGIEIWKRISKEHGIEFENKDFSFFNFKRSYVITSMIARIIKKTERVIYND